MRLKERKQSPEQFSKAELFQFQRLLTHWWVCSLLQSAYYKVNKLLGASGTAGK